MSAKHNQSYVDFVIYPARGDGVMEDFDGRMMLTSPEQVAEYEANPDLFVSLEDYCEWVETFGTPQCGARTKSGHLCRNAARYGSFDACSDGATRRDQDVDRTRRSAGGS
jgi:hypothetical protein